MCGDAATDVDAGGSAEPGDCADDQENARDKQARRIDMRTMKSRSYVPETLERRGHVYVVVDDDEKGFARIVGVYSSLKKAKQAREKTFDERVTGDITIFRRLIDDAYCFSNGTGAVGGGN